MPVRDDGGGDAAAAYARVRRTRLMGGEAGAVGAGQPAPYPPNPLSPADGGKGASGIGESADRYGAGKQAALPPVTFEQIVVRLLATQTALLLHLARIGGARNDDLEAAAQNVIDEAAASIHY